MEWRKKPGDPVWKGDILFVLETEKVTYEVESPEDGPMGKVLVKEQETVPVGAVIAYLLKPGEHDIEIAAAPAAAAVPASAAPPAGGRVKATPLAKKVAKEYGIGLDAVAGTGPGGRILHEDVEKAKAAGVQAPAATPAPASPAQAAPAARGCCGRTAYCLHRHAQDDRQENGSRARSRRPRPIWATPWTPPASRGCAWNCCP